MNKPEEMRSVPWGWIEATMGQPVGSLPLGSPRPGNQGGMEGWGLSLHSVLRHDVIKASFIILVHFACPQLLSIGFSFNFTLSSVLFDGEIALELKL